MQNRKRFYDKRSWELVRTFSSNSNSRSAHKFLEDVIFRWWSTGHTCITSPYIIHPWWWHFPQRIHADDAFCILEPTDFEELPIDCTCIWQGWKCYRLMVDCLACDWRVTSSIPNVDLWQFNMFFTSVFSLHSSFQGIIHHYIYFLICIWTQISQFRQHSKFKLVWFLDLDPMKIWKFSALSG